ncbi:hypothetical protein PC119_g26341 [Phytophthora cactorum]|nr:hypothetical protein PC119_g26341 [Phytophthora cactorum]
MMHFVVQDTDQQLEPAEIVCDFETGLLNAVNTQFPNALVIGCLFHLKHALRRAMKRFAIPEEECSIAVISGVLNMFPVVEHSLIERGTKGKATWMEQYGVEVWNVAGLENELIAPTNNPLERFNRELNSRFPSPRPSVATFVGVVKTLSSEYVQRLADVPHGRVRRAPRERIQLPVPVEIPEDIADDSDEDEPLALEHASDSSLDEESNDDEDEGTGFSV